MYLSFLKDRTIITYSHVPFINLYSAFQTWFEGNYPSTLIPNKMEFGIGIKQYIVVEKVKISKKVVCGVKNLSIINNNGENDKNIKLLKYEPPKITNNKCDTKNMQSLKKLFVINNNGDDQLLKCEPPKITNIIPIANIDDTKIINPTSIYNYIYLLQEREFIKTNENIYKIGRTNQCFTKRFKQYPKNSKLYLVLEVNDNIKAESALKKALTEKFIKRKDIGEEYFQGSIKAIKNTVISVCRDFF